MSIDPERKLAQMRPKNHQGRFFAKSRKPNRVTQKRIWHSKHVAEFMVDAMEDGYMDSDGEGNMFKVKLDNISRNTLLHLIDSDKVSRHMALKEEGKVVISSKKMFRDGFGKRVSPEVIKRRTSAGYGPVAVTTKTSSGKSASYEEKLLANVAEREAKRKEEVAEANKKMRESKKKSGKKDLDKALLNLVNSGQVFTIENLNSEMERMSGQ